MENRTIKKVKKAEDVKLEAVVKEAVMEVQREEKEKKEK